MPDTNQEHKIMQDTYYLRNRIEDGEILSPGINMHAYIMYVNIRAYVTMYNPHEAKAKQYIFTPRSTVVLMSFLINVGSYWIVSN
jgi:hypothetical protein